MIKLILCGSNGQMGKVIADQVDEMDGYEIVAGMDRGDNYGYDFPTFKDINEFEGKADAIIDFSNPSTLPVLLKYSTKTKTPLVIASTGFSDEEVKSMEQASKETAILYSGNMSLGINVLLSLVKKATSALEGFDIEVIEKHHNKKVDSPSGTAFMIANAIDEERDGKTEFVHGREGNATKRKPEEVGIHAIRGGTIVGEHSVIFAGVDEVIEIKHSAMSKKIFAVGSINAAKFLVNKETGLYSMDDLFTDI